MTEPFTIRVAVPADVEIICAHRRAMFGAMGSARERIAAMDAPFARWLTPRLARGEYCGWLAENAHGTVIAGVGLWLVAGPPTPSDQSLQRGYVFNVFTEPDFRRRGIARQLMNTVMAWCRANEIRVIALHASDDGRALYASLGFEPTNEMRILLPTSNL